ncbi:MAG TPA: NAD(P)-dependent oxidoreductase [Myxococcaceae bacterium]|nr:NAD(P)-dependent oxidoreductase [Myxococcaceae bacterium]
MMPVLVTGSTGRIGSRLVPRLLRANVKLRLLVRNPQRVEAFAERGADVITGDLRDAEVVKRALDEVYAVVHLGAAFRGVPDAEMEAVNLAATRQLAELARTRRFVHASTGLVYGPGRGRPAREEDELQPPEGSPYPRTKAAAEEALRGMAKEGLDLRVLRLGFVYGDADPHLEESLRWATQWPAHKRLHMLHHADVGQAVLRLLLAEGLERRIFNIADDAPVTAHELCALNHESLPPEAATRPLDDPWEGIMDTSLARELLGFRPIYPTVYEAQDAGTL